MSFRVEVNQGMKTINAVGLRNVSGSEKEKIGKNLDINSMSRK